MTSIVRIKRRRTDDPAEALVLSHKKSRIAAGADPTAPQPPPQSQNLSLSPSENNESLLEFAGTIASKDEPVYSHIKEAIRKKKIHKQMHPHSSETTHRTDLTSRLRKQKAETAHNNRYRITCHHRAIDIHNSDNDRGVCSKETEGASKQSGHGSSDENKENSSKLSESIKETLQNARDASSSSEKMTTKIENEKSIDSNVDDSLCRGTDKEGKVFYLIDIEKERAPDPESKPAASAITVNGIPMTQVKTKVPIAEESDDYVYDLYYTHTRLSDIQDEAVVTVQALCDEFMHGERDDEGEDFVYEDEDDSNDESNWRNDYPDEDPHFFENAEGDYDYKNDMRESVFNGDRDDEGDLLSYWMDTRCTIDVDCKDFDENYERDVSSSDEEAGAELGLY